MNEKLNNSKIKSRLEQQKEDMMSYINQLANEIEKKHSEKRQIESLNEIMSWLDENFMNLMEVMEQHVMLALQYEFNTFFQSWFEIIMQNGISVRIDDSFSPVIIQNGFDTDYSNLSGGEKTSVALAYRLALNKVINSISENIKTKDIIILDEPTDGFSNDQLDKLRDVIAQLALKQIIIVSHEPKIDTFVESVIKLYKENHTSRIEYQ
jgi:exonuclease SbcC